MKKVKSKVLLLILLTIIILFFILKDDFNGILSALLSANPIYLILIFLIKLLNVILVAIWKLSSSEAIIFTPFS